MNKILVIGYVWPEPNSSAAGSHMMSLLRLYRSQGWQVEFATPAQPTEHMVDLSSEGISSKSIRLNCDSFDQYVSIYQPNIVMFDRYMMEEQFGWRVEKACPSAVKILDTEDLQCLRHARHQAYKAGRSMSPKDLFSDIAKREIAAILRCDLSLIISSFEIDLLVNTFNISQEIIEHTPFMVDINSLSKQTTPFDERQHFISIGNFRHAPNWNAVLKLQQLWPAIRKQLPKAECHIYGSYPPPKATALDNPKTGFLIKGWADDALKVMEQSKVCLAPIQFGAGIKGKLLDAMLAQTPSITTEIGSEGMHNGEPWPGIVVQSDNEFVEAAVAVYQNKSLWLSAQNNISALLKNQFDGDKISQQLLNRIDAVTENLTQHRLNNFTGAMLKHHSMMSTKYMSQWIAEKNKPT
jgi:glycosyltransferase involved in cell wall biosynthesis